MFQLCVRVCVSAVDTTILFLPFITEQNEMAWSYKVWTLACVVWHVIFNVIYIAVQCNVIYSQTSDAQAVLLCFIFKKKLIDSNFLKTIF